MSQPDEFWMRKALEVAKLGQDSGEVPVGAVIIDAEGNLLSEAANAPISLNDPSAHAEMLAIRAAAGKKKSYRLDGMTLYCTLEPCPMCAGALIHSRVSRLVFGARDLRFGGVRSKFQIVDSGILNHSVSVTEGVLGAECTQILVEFFKLRR